MSRSASGSDRSSSTTTPSRRGTRSLVQLSDAEAAVYRSVDVEGLRPVELARHMDRSESTIRTLLSRARSKLEEET